MLTGVEEGKHRRRWKQHFTTDYFLVRKDKSKNNVDGKIILKNIPDPGFASVGS